MLKVHRSAQPPARKAASLIEKKLGSFVSVVVSELWERFLTAITRVFVAGKPLPLTINCNLNNFNS